MLAMNEWTAVEVAGGFGDEISPFRPGKAALLKLRDGSWVQVPGNPTTWIFGVARALGKLEEMAALGWHSKENTQGKEEEIRQVMQQWAAEYESMADFEAALDTARIPLGKVKPLAGVAQEDWAIARDAFVEVDANGEAVSIPRSPFRFSRSEAGPTGGSRLQGADNREALKALLQLSDAALDALEAAGVLISKP